MRLLAGACFVGVTGHGEAKLDARPLRILSIPSRNLAVFPVFEDVSRLASSPGGKPN